MRVKRKLHTSLHTWTCTHVLVVRAHLHMCAHKPVLCACTCLHVCLCMCAHGHTQACACVHVCGSVCTHTHMHVRVCACTEAWAVHTCLHAHAHAHTIPGTAEKAWGPLPCALSATCPLDPTQVNVRPSVAVGLCCAPALAQIQNPSDDLTYF